MDAPAPPRLVLHERRSAWSRQLRPRLASRPIRWVETRSGAELAAALSACPCPVAVFDLSGRPTAALSELAEATAAAPDALVVVLDRGARPGVPALARELGATLVLPGLVVPPRLVAVLEPWLRLARARRDASGWVRPDGPAADPLELLLAP